MGAGNPVFQMRMRPDVRERLEKAQDKIKSYSGEEMPLATIVRHALDQYLDYVLSDDRTIEDLKDVPRQRRIIDSLSVTDEATKRKIIEEFDFSQGT